MIIRTMTFTAGSAVVTANKTALLRSGWYVYANSLPVETQIVAITDGTHFTISNQALASATETVESTYATVGVKLERDDALIDIESICRERGQLVRFQLEIEAGVTRGSYGGIEQRTAPTELVTYAFPVEYAPSVRRLEKAGLREESPVICYCPSRTFIKAGIEFSDINVFDGALGVDARRSFVYMNGEKYEIKEKSRTANFSDVFEYYTFGMIKR